MAVYDPWRCYKKGFGLEDDWLWTVRTILEPKIGKDICAFVLMPMVKVQCEICLQEVDADATKGPIPQMFCRYPCTSCFYKFYDWLARYPWSSKCVEYVDRPLTFVSQERGMNQSMKKKQPRLLLMAVYDPLIRRFLLPVP